MDTEKINRLKIVLVEQGKTGKWLAGQLGKNEATVSRWCSNASQPSQQWKNGKLDMLTESQNIEFKESWRDEYQKWICGFANAQGGVLFVGVKNNGEVCGVQDAKKLMEDIPNKVRDIMGILVDVNLKEKDGKSYLEIVTEAYPYPVSFRGKYYPQPIRN